MGEMKNACILAQKSQTRWKDDIILFLEVQDVIMWTGLKRFGLYLFKQLYECGSRLAGGMKNCNL